MRYANAKSKYTAHKNRCSDSNPKYDANGCRVEFNLTFGEWYDIWGRSGKWKLRGAGKGKYCMSRHDDLGHYEIGNVSIKLHTENTIEASVGRTFKHTPEAKIKIGEASRNRIVSEETKKKMSVSQTGKIQSESTKAKLSALWKGKPKKRVTCEFCGFETSPQNLSRHRKVCVNKQE